MAITLGSGKSRQDIELSNSRVSKISRGMQLLLMTFLVMIFNVGAINGAFKFTFLPLITPLGESASTIVSAAQGFYDSVKGISTMRSRLNELELTNVLLKGENEQISLLKNENAALKKQLQLGQNERKLVQAEVLSKDFSEESEILYINEGKKSGLKEGDIALIGNLFIGTLFNVEENSSKIRLPTNQASFLEVSVLNGDLAEKSVAEIEASYQSVNSVKGVANGQLSNIIVEEIDRNAKVERSNEVFVTDTKVGMILYLGEVVSVESSASSASQAVLVQSPVDYFALKYIFITPKLND